jgi:hypothetical protein
MCHDAEPLIITPFCPDNMILAWFSGVRCVHGDSGLILDKVVNVTRLAFGQVIQTRSSLLRPLIFFPNCVKHFLKNFSS